MNDKDQTELFKQFATSARIALPALKATSALQLTKPVTRSVAILNPSSKASGVRQIMVATDTEGRGTAYSKLRLELSGEALRGLSVWIALDMPTMRMAYCLGGVVCAFGLHKYSTVEAFLKFVPKERLWYEKVLVAQGI